jgi:hypothetical protein
MSRVSFYTLHAFMTWSTGSGENFLYSEELLMKCHRLVFSRFLLSIMTNYTFDSSVFFVHNLQKNIDMGFFNILRPFPR